MEIRVRFPDYAHFFSFLWKEKGDMRWATNGLNLMKMFFVERNKLNCLCWYKISCWQKVTRKMLFFVVYKSCCGIVRISCCQFCFYKITLVQWKWKWDGKHCDLTIFVVVVLWNASFFIMLIFVNNTHNMLFCCKKLVFNNNFARILDVKKQFSLKVLFLIFSLVICI